MYSNNSESIKDALCFFLDEEKGKNVGFVQYPQNFDNITKNDLYGNSLNTSNEGGPPYIGTGCFHRRESLCGRKYNSDYKEVWKREIERKVEESAYILEEKAKALTTCTYELNTQWGKEIGLKFGCPVEDVITGLTIQCRGWKSMYSNPPTKGFSGVAPTTLEQTLVQHKRWADGNFQIFLSKYFPFIYGHGRTQLGLQMGYIIYGLWAPISFPSLYYFYIPFLSLLKGVSLFPKISSPWFIPFAYVIVAKLIYSLVESLLSGDTLIGWWNLQRMWVLRRITSYIYAFIDNILKLLGISKIAFAITAKVTDGDISKRYEKEVMEFGSQSSMFMIITTYALLNILCLMGGINKLIINDGFSCLDAFTLQLVLCALVVGINVPIYRGVFVRKDKGSMPHSIILTSIGFAMLACLLPIV